LALVGLPYPVTKLLAVKVNKLLDTWIPFLKNETSAIFKMGKPAAKEEGSSVVESIVILK
jgi:hypothetical protein